MFPQPDTFGVVVNDIERPPRGGQSSMQARGKTQLAIEGMDSRFRSHLRQNRVLVHAYDDSLFLPACGLKS
jgi:hypothetical protein